MAIYDNRVPSSFRDPSGFVFIRSGQIFRAVANSYRENYDILMKSGLYDKLVGERMLVGHEEKDARCASSDIYRIIKPQKIPFISYPYEWSFSELKDAALLTLEIAKIALRFGMSLKDASAYNIQFLNSRPILIDTLSFEKYEEGKPWVAYKQFCQHFLAPLALSSYCDERLSRMTRVFIDGIPLDLASRLLPARSKLNMLIYLHLHLHAVAQKRYANSPGYKIPSRFSRKMFESMIESLKRAIESLNLPKLMTEWGEYYSNTNYDNRARKSKMALVEKYITRVNPKTVWDLGANDGTYSRLASARGIQTVAFDVDPVAVEKGYLATRGSGENILFLLLDLMNPSPSQGWAEEERISLSERGSADLVLALALVHHLAISNNTPFDKIAKYFSRLGRFLVIEFVPKTDSKVKKLLSTREDIFFNYNQEEFEKDFKKYFRIVKCEKISGSKRILYLMQRDAN